MKSRAYRVVITASLLTVLVYHANERVQGHSIADPALRATENDNCHYKDGRQRLRIDTSCARLAPSKIDAAIAPPEDIYEANCSYLDSRNRLRIKSLCPNTEQRHTGEEFSFALMTANVDCSYRDGRHRLRYDKGCGSQYLKGSKY